MKTRLKAIASIVCFCIICSFTACSDSSKGTDVDVEEEEEVEILDLTGNWVSKEKGDDTYLAGYIKDDVIELFWIYESDNMSALYWSGSYVAPEDDVDEYKWESVNDKSKTNGALLASTADTKLFEYSNGELKYEMSALGTTTTMILVRTDDDYSNLASSVSSEAQVECQPLEITETSYQVTWLGLLCEFEIYNPNEDYGAQRVQVQVTARRADNTIIGTSTMSCPDVAAKDTIVFGLPFEIDGEEGMTVECEIVDNSVKFIKQEGTNVLHHNDLSTSNLSIRNADYKLVVTGEVTNTTEKDYSLVEIYVLFKKDDKYVYCESNIVDDLMAGSTIPFQIDVLEDSLDYDSYEVYAYY